MTDTITTDTGRPARAGRRRTPAADRAEKPEPAPAFPPTFGYVAVHRNWNPADAPWSAWNPKALKQAKADLAYYQTIGSDEYVIVRVDTAFTVVGGGDGA